MMMLNRACFRMVCVFSAVVSSASLAQPLDPDAFSSLGTLNLSAGDYIIDTDSLTITDVTGGASALLFTGVADDQGGTADYLSGNWVPGSQGIPEIAVFTFDGIDLQPTANVAIAGTRAVALLSQSDATIGTPLAVDGVGAGDPAVPGQTGLPGPGGFAGAQILPNANPVVELLGSGPGGGQSALENGTIPGLANSTAGPGSFGGQGIEEAGASGPTYGDLTASLQGGSGGGAHTRFGFVLTAEFVGGGGGGAIELAAAGTLTIDAPITARGGDAYDQWGAAGGSGGGIRVHAPDVQLNANLVARGGDDARASRDITGGGGRIYFSGDTASPFVYQVGGANADWTSAAFADFANLDVRPGLDFAADPNGVIPPQATVANFGVLTLRPRLTVVPEGQTVELGRPIDASGPEINLEVLPFNTRILDGGLAEIGQGQRILPSQSIELAGPGATILSTTNPSASLFNDGTITGTGRVETLVNNRDGGAVNAVNDALTFTQQASGAAGSEVNAINSTLDFEQGYNNAGDINLISTTFHGDLINNGTVSLAGTNTFTGNVSGSGEFTGTGTVIFTGSFSPGNSPGRVDHEGGVTFASTHTLLIELAGDGGVAGVDFDQINVEGLLTIDGVLQLATLDEYVPTPGEAFVFLTGETTTGSFEGLSEGDSAARINGMDLVISYAAGDGNDVALIAVPEPGSLLLVLAGLPAVMRRRRRTHVGRDA